MKLNLGSGPVRVEGYISVDIREDAQPDLLADAAHLTMVEDNSIDAIYASHLLEHFAYNEPVLEEWHRVLVPGGEILIIVPDFMHMYELYIAGAFTLEFFNGIFYGQAGYPPEYQHKQVFTPVMLINAMQPLFRDVATQFESCVRTAYIGETMALGHKL
jgi:predicted SAM-dependent methyltransferase